MNTQGTEPPPAGRRVDPVFIWSVHLSDGDWYWVFARSGSGAEQIVARLHYEMKLAEFRRTYSPNVLRFKDSEKLAVDTERGSFYRTCKQWAKNEKPGPFVSNTYEI